MMKSCQKINLQELQRNRNTTAIFVNLIRTSTVSSACNHLENGHIKLSLGKRKICVYDDQTYPPP